MMGRPQNLIARSHYPHSLQMAQICSNYWETRHEFLLSMTNGKSVVKSNALAQEGGRCHQYFMVWLSDSASSLPPATHSLSGVSSPQNVTNEPVITTAFSKSTFPGKGEFSRDKKGVKASLHSNEPYSAVGEAFMWGTQEWPTLLRKPYLSPDASYAKPYNNCEPHTGPSPTALFHLCNAVHTTVFLFQ